ncbi:hypothetical protein SprV_0902694600 [Sparganum proliferum]
MSQPSRRNPPRERRSALEEALYYFNGEGISSPEINESQYDMGDSDDTLPSREPMWVEERYETLPTDRLANLDRAVALLIQHNARLSKKMDLILDSNRRLHGRLRELEAKVTQRPPAPGATPLPQNPIKRVMRTAADFHQLNNLLEGNEVRNQLVGRPFIPYTKHKVSFLSCLGGNNLDDFVKRIFFELFEDEIALHVNFKGRKMKYSLCNSAVYKVVLDLLADGHLASFFEAPLPRGHSSSQQALPGALTCSHSPNFNSDARVSTESQLPMRHLNLPPNLNETAAA